MSLLQRFLPVIGRRAFSWNLLLPSCGPVVFESQSPFCHPVLRERQLTEKQISTFSGTKCFQNTTNSYQSPFKLCPSLRSEHILSTNTLPFQMQQNRGYKAKRVLKLRCEGCYFVRKDNQLYVHCDLKPRHKQMQLISKRNIFRDDYSRGNVRRAIYWKSSKNNWYKYGDNEFSRYNWLGDRIGKEI